MNNRTTTESKWTQPIEWGVLLLMVAAAAALRYWHLEDIPPGFNSDEAVGAMGALKTLREGIQYSYEGQGGGGALGFYFAAASFYLFGPSIAAIRGVAAWAGVMSVFTNYWAVREIFRNQGLVRARWIAGLSTLGLTFSVWHIWASRVAFATIGVPLLMLPSVFFLWWGLNHPRQKWAFVASGIFLAAGMYIYLSGVFAPPLYAAFFISQWLLIFAAKKLKQTPNPPSAYLTSQFWNLFITAMVALLLLLPVAYVLLFNPSLEPGGTRVSQAIFTNPQINHGDPWGLLWRSFTGNFSAYGVSLLWLTGQVPRLSFMPPAIGALVFVGFLIALVQSLRGQAAYLFIWLWYGILLLPSILSPDSIPHNLRTIGATTPTYVFAAITVVSVADLLWRMARRGLAPRLGLRRTTWLARAAGLLIGLWLGWQFWQVNQPFLYDYFFVYPQTNDAQAAFHVYAVEMAKEINREPDPGANFILLRNTAAGETHPNFTTDFLTELAQPPAAHTWVEDDERTLPAALTAAAATHDVLRVVYWRTSKHTGADPKEAIPYYLEKYGYRDHKHGFKYFDIVTYQLQTPSPDFSANETLSPVKIDFGGQFKLTGFAFGDAGNVDAVTQPQARSFDLLWLRVRGQKTADHPENLKITALIYTEAGELVTRVDKPLLNNILQQPSSQWEVGAETDAYFLIPIPEGTPPGKYNLRVAVYGEDSQARLPVVSVVPEMPVSENAVILSDFTVLLSTKHAKLEHMTMAFPVGRELLPGLTLAGFETLPGTSVRSGQKVGASLLWQSSGDTPPAQDAEMSLAAKPVGGGTEWAISQPLPLVSKYYPSSQWETGKLMRGWLTTRIPPEMEPGRYQLDLRLTDAHAPETELARLPVGEFEITGWTRNFTAPQPQQPVGADFGGLATLLGVDADTAALSPGGTFNVTLHWRADAEFDRDYKAFVQIIGPEGQLFGQVDQTPGAGQFPTSGWLPGEYIADSYAVPLDPATPPGEYGLLIGLYYPDTGQRLPVSGGNCGPDACLLPGITVK